MFVWGSRSGVVDLGAQGSKPCPVCERERTFRLMLQYKMAHVWHVFKWVSEKQYALVCEVCHRGEKLVTQAVEAKIGRPKIPAERSRKWMFVVAVLAVMVIVGLIEAPERARRMEALLSAPQKSDLYVMNVATLLKSPQALGMYGLLRVRSVDAERVEFETPAIAYEKQSGVDKDLRNGRYTEPAYFSGEPLLLTRQELAAMQKRHTLISIERP